MKKGLLLVAMVTFNIVWTNAQTISFPEVYEMSLTGANAIKEGSEVKGYYFFFKGDKIDKKTSEFTLHITDNNLTKIKEIKMQSSKDVTIVESSFNGTDLIFLLYNDKERSLEYQVYGADGKKKHTYNRELSKKEISYFQEVYFNEDEDQNFKGLYPIEGKGFISNMPSREDKDFTFQLDYFSTEKRKQWTYIPTIGAKKFIGDYLGTHNGVVYMEVLKMASRTDSKPESFLVGLDLQTGRQLFEKPTDDGKFKFYPASMTILADSTAYVFGEYFNPNGNILKDKSLGFAFWGVDKKGKILSEKYNSWDLELGKHLNVSSKGKIDDFGYMYLHNLVQTDDGNIYAIGEGYVKLASVAGMALAVLSKNPNSSSLVRMRITNMIFIKFDKDFNVKEAQIFEKNSNTYYMPSGVALASAALLGKMVKSFGGFDYSYTQVNKDNSAFTVCYSDYVKGKGYKGATFNSISYNEGKLTTDNINTKSTNNKARTFVLPGKQGQVLLIDYYKKDKRVDMHVEKLN